MTAQSLIRPESLSKIGASSSTRLLNEDRLYMRSRNARRRGQQLRAGATPAYRKFTAEEAPSLTAAARAGDGNMRSGRKNARGAGRDRKSDVKGKRVGLAGRCVIKK